MTPLNAIATVIGEEAMYQGSLKRYLQCHVNGEILFDSWQALPCSGACVDWPRHVRPGCDFGFEFHLSYVALRKAGSGVDPRGIRQQISMLEPLDADVASAEELICYDAQISFTILGKNKTCWKAYCNVDTWFGSEIDVETYLAKDKDAPSGGTRLASGLCLNPTEYFLLVMRHRFRQTGMEWGNLCTVLMTRLDTYVSTTTRPPYP